MLLPHFTKKIFDELEITKKINNLSKNDFDRRRLFEPTCVTLTTLTTTTIKTATKTESETDENEENRIIVHGKYERKENKFYFGAPGYELTVIVIAVTLVIFFFGIAIIATIMNRQAD